MRTGRYLVMESRCHVGRGGGFLSVENNERETKQEPQRELLRSPASRDAGTNQRPRLRAPERPHAHPSASWPGGGMRGQRGQQSPGHPPLLMLAERRALHSAGSKRHILGAIPPRHGPSPLHSLQGAWTL